MSDPAHKPATLDCCELHACGGAMGQPCSDIPDVSDLMGESLDAWNQHARTSPRPAHPGSVEGDKVGLDTERKDEGAPFRLYHSTCQKCGATKSRGSVRVGVKRNPMRCPRCEPKAYAREHGFNTPTANDFLESRKNPDATITIEPPTLAELTILCALDVLGGSAQVSTLDLAYKPTTHTMRALTAKRWAGLSRNPGPPVLVITMRGRQAMRAGLSLTMITPNT